MTKVKICGLQRAEDILAVNQLLPDYIGFVFAKSKRQITKVKAIALKQLLNPKIQVVGVFVDAAIDEILSIAAEHIIDIIQLHGHESKDYITTLKQSTPLPIIKAVRVKASEDITEAAKLPSDYLLLDTYKQGEMGGSGLTFDWSLIPANTKTYFLAGGLSAENVSQALTHLTPYCVDVSSHVETDGQKDYEKIAAFLAAVRKEN